MRKLIDEQAEDAGKQGSQLRTEDVYNAIRRSNSSLKRRSKKLLEDSIERVLVVMREELDDSDSMDTDVMVEEDIVVRPKVVRLGASMCRKC